MVKKSSKSKKRVTASELRRRKGQSFTSSTGVRKDPKTQLPVVGFYENNLVAEHPYEDLRDCSVFDLGLCGAKYGNS